MARVGAATATPNPRVPALPEQEALGLGNSWSRCQMRRGGDPLGKPRQPCLSSHPK